MDDKTKVITKYKQFMSADDIAWIESLKQLKDNRQFTLVDELIEW